jgi:hypothetical protein
MTDYERLLRWSRVSVSSIRQLINFTTVPSRWDGLYFEGPENTVEKRMTIHQAPTPALAFRPLRLRVAIYWLHNEKSGTRLASSRRMCPA